MALVTLQSFQPEASIQLQAGVQVLGLHERLFQFSWHDPEQKIIWPKTENLPQRRDEIWKHSCFEVFWGEFSATSYWELNLNPSQHWNLYRFKSERSPQPPTPDHTFVVEGIQWAATKAEVLVKGPWGNTGFQGTFCAVTELANEKLYWATTHSSSKPDFHRRMDWQQRF